MRNAPVPAPPPPPTFGSLREHGLGFIVTCRRCGRTAKVSYKASRFLRGRLPDKLKLSDVGERFRCQRCNGNRVKVLPEAFGAARLEAGRS